MVNKDVIIALDFDNFNKVEQFLNKFDKLENKPYVKVGMELYYKEGVKIIEYLKEKEYKIFLDLKLHDIPMTVKKALTVLKPYNIEIINVHATGGQQMLEEAAKVFEGTNTKLIAVSVLTSLNDSNLEQLGFNLNVEELVLSLAKLSKDCGLSGIVCSCHEVKKIKETLGSSFLTITPGIRLLGDDSADQKRVMTPEEAKEVNTNFIVVGRSITNSTDALSTYLEVKKQFLGDNNEH